MAENKRNSAGTRPSRLGVWVWSGAAFIFLVPLLAMQVTDAVTWGVGDFVLLGAILLGLGAAIELVARKSKNAAYRTAVVLALAGAFLLMVVNGAVGIIGSDNNEANLMYAGVVAIGLVGTAIARFRPLGMARAMYATALAQVVVAVIALAGGLGSDGSNWPAPLLGATAFFAALWFLSARLFLRADRGGMTRR